MDAWKLPAMCGCAQVKVTRRGMRQMQWSSWNVVVVMVQFDQLSRKQKCKIMIIPTSLDSGKLSTKPKTNWKFPIVSKKLF